MNYTNSGLIRDQLDDIGRTTIFAEILLLDDLHWDPATLSDLHWDPAPLWSPLRSCYSIWSSLRSCYSMIFTEILILYDLHWDPAPLWSPLRSCYFTIYLSRSTSGEYKVADSPCDLSPLMIFINWLLLCFHETRSNKYCFHVDWYQLSRVSLVESRGGVCQITAVIFYSQNL